MITKDMLILDILNAGDSEKIAECLIESGMHCLGCPVAHGETLEQATAAHQIELEPLLAKLNAIVAEG